MRFIGLLAIIALWVSAASAQASAQREALIEAISAAEAREWVAVDALRPRLTKRTNRDIIDWMRLRGRQGNFAECQDFLERNADWPGLKLLRLRCEYTIPRDKSPAQVLAFFGGKLPQTGVGSLRLAAALISKGREEEAISEVRRAWLAFNLSESEHNAFVKRHGDVLKDLHENRLDAVLWRNARKATRRMYPLVGDDWKKLADARIALRDRKGGVDAAVESVPKALKDDAGLAYERFLWRAAKGLDESAIEILVDRSISLEALGEPKYWADRRRSLARQVMRDGDAVLAYALASSHFLTEGSAFADLEWLSGFLALRKLNSPVQALEHFRNFEGAVETPISLGRAGYWLGRAYEAAGEAAEADKAYRFGAQYQSSFYGQLAAEKAGIATDPRMAGKQNYPDWHKAPFIGSSVFAAAMELQAAGQRDLAERFLVHLAESLDPEGLGQLGDLALELEEPHIALKISKQAARMGHELYKTYYPLGPPVGQSIPVAMEFALSIARRESEFDPVVVSPAGARGLMQLMPATAKEVAGELDLEYSRTKLTSDPAYNATLGSAYLAGLAKRFDSNPVLMSIGYNAGPSRARRWPELFGDPRDASVDAIDWIEGIPFRETRNYVMRVTESFAPYRARLSGQVAPIRLSEELKM